MFHANFQSTTVQGLRRSTADVAHFGIRQIATACVASGIAAAAITLLTAAEPAKTSGVTITVDRANKSDRLKLTPANQQPRNDFNSSQSSQRPKPVPTGCESAFGPNVRPARVDVMRYCLA